MRTKLILILALIFLVGCASELEIKGAKQSLPRQTEWYFIRSPQTGNCYEVIWSTVGRKVAMSEVDSEFCIEDPVRTTATN